MRILLVLILLGSASAFVSLDGNAQQAPNLTHKPAPQFAKLDLNQHLIDLKNYHGKVVLLNFWATWCAPCQVELPKFDAWQKKYGPAGLQVVAVSMDDGDEAVRKTARRLRLGFPVVMGDATVGEAYGGVLGLPITFLIDRNGIVTEKIKGETNLEQMELHVRKLLFAESKNGNREQKLVSGK